MEEREEMGREGRRVSPDRGRMYKESRRKKTSGLGAERKMRDCEWEEPLRQSTQVWKEASVQTLK